MLNVKNTKKYSSLFITACLLMLSGMISFSGCGNGRPPEGEQCLTSITSSADGKNLAAVSIGNSMKNNHGYIYTSTDFGTTWKQQRAAGNTNWTGIASSADGSKLSVVSTGDCKGSYNCSAGSILTSNDSGITWTEQNTSVSMPWFAVASSLDGSMLTAVNRGGNGSNAKIYISSDSGLTWSDVSPIAPVNQGYQFVSVTSSGNGQYRAAANLGCSNQYGTVTAGTIFTSSNYGSSWTERTITGDHYWLSVVYSTDGSRLAAFDGGSLDSQNPRTAGNIYISTDNGANWSKAVIAGDHYWYGIAISSDGTKLAAVDGGTGKTGGYIYTSSDGGATWTARTDAGCRFWLSIASSSDGMKLAATNVEGLITASSDGGATWSSRLFSSSIGGSAESLAIYNAGVCIFRDAAYESSSDTMVQNGGALMFFMVKQNGVWVNNPSLINSINITRPDSGTIAMRTNTAFGQIDVSHVWDGYVWWSKASPIIQMKWIDFSQDTLAAGSYIFNVTDTSGHSASATATFGSGTDPMTTNPIYPTNISYNTSTRVLSWTGVTGAANYRILISEGSESSADIIYNSNKISIAGTSAVIPSAVPFITGNIYYFLIDAHDSSDGNVCNSNYMHRSAAYSITY